MRLKKKFNKNVLTILIFGALFLSFLSIFELDQDYVVPQNEEAENDLFPKSSGFWELSSINIHNNWAETKANNDWCNGAGTWDDPYVIENVTIDGQGSGYGIYVADSSEYFIIRNCTLTNSTASNVGTGIALSNVINGFLIENNCSLNARGISIHESNNITISGNLISDNPSVGLLTDTYPNHNITIIGNDIFRNKYGIWLAETYDTIIENNNILYNTADGIHLCRSNNTKIIGNNCSFSDDYGIQVDANSHGTQIIDNDCSNNYYSGIYLLGSENCSIIGNSLNKNGLAKTGLVHSGLNINSGMGYNIIYNTCNDNYFSGIRIVNSNENNAINNTCTGNGYDGIYIIGDLNNISKNICNNNEEVGIYIYSGVNNSVTWNTILGNSDCIWDYGSETIINNNINDCDETEETPDDDDDPTLEIPGYELIAMISLIGIFSLFLTRQLTRKTKISQN